MNWRIWNSLPAGNILTLSSCKEKTHGQKEAGCFMVGVREGREERGGDSWSGDSRPESLPESEKSSVYKNWLPRCSVQTRHCKCFKAQGVKRIKWILRFLQNLQEGGRAMQGALGLVVGREGRKKGGREWASLQPPASVVWVLAPPIPSCRAASVLLKFFL